MPPFIGRGLISFNESVVKNYRFISTVVIDSMYFTFQRIVQGYGLTDLDQPDIRISFFICIKSGMRGLSDPIGGQLAFGGGDIENHSGSHEIGRASCRQREEV